MEDTAPYDTAYHRVDKAAGRQLQLLRDMDEGRPVDVNMDVNMAG